MLTVFRFKMMNGNLVAELPDGGEVLSDALSLLVLDAVCNSSVLGTELLEFLSVLWHVEGSVINNSSDVFEAMIKVENGVVEESLLVSHSWGINVDNVLVKIHLKGVSESCEVSDQIPGLIKLKVLDFELLLGVNQDDLSVSNTFILEISEHFLSYKLRFNLSFKVFIITI